jgi:hypothetical protein
MNESQNERIHRCLDGDLHRDELTLQELQELVRYEQINEEVQKLHRSVKAPDLTASIMGRLPQTPSEDAHPAPRSWARTPLAAGVHRRISAWLWTPRAMRLRPAYGVAAVLALLLAAFVMRSNNLSLQERLRMAEANAGAGTIFVQFRLDAPQASAVQLVGSFTGWKPAYTLKQASPGVWSILIPLTPGVHDYAFLVNGKWVADPAAPAVDDGFGGANSRLLVVLPDKRSRL